MKIFGGILPFVGFREEEVDDQMRRFFDFPEEITRINTFQIEWFWHAVVICIGPVDE
jgi:hypothetical protein